MSELNYKKENLKKERYKLLNKLEKKLELPMILLSVAWLVSVVLSVLHKMFLITAVVIWSVFVLEVIAKVGLAVNKLFFIKKRPILIACLVFPAIRVMQIYLLLKRKETIRKQKNLHFKNSKYPRS